MDVDGEQGAGKEDRRKREEREEESARDVFAGVDALRDAFGSALDGAPGARWVNAVTGVFFIVRKRGGCLRL